MVSQASQLDYDVNIHFVIPNKCNSEEDCSELMWHAYNKCSEYDLNPQWITEKKCFKLNPIKSDVFVIEEFQGDAFDKLKSYKCSIVAPRCLLICFVNGEAIPEGTSPIYTPAMRGLCICVSGLSPENKSSIQQKVEYMGGFFTKQLRSCVTHLVTDSVMSAKYERGVELRIPIVTKHWVEAIWETNLEEYVKADDKAFDDYKCPVFMNLIATSTNLSRQQKEEVKDLINNNGGTFMGPLDGSKVRVVLTPEHSPLSEKLRYALQNNIACLKPEWVYESVKIGYALPFNKFLVKSTKAHSTPERVQEHETFNISTISTIPPCDPQQYNYVDESLASTVTNFSTMERMSINSGVYLTVLDRLTLSEAKLAGPFLDGCNIYLAGFAPNQRDKLNRILNVGSATRLDDMSDALTHVILGDENKAANELKIMQSKSLKPYILNLNWLEESIKLKRPAPEEHFLYRQKNSTPRQNNEPPSPLSKKNLQMLQQPRRTLIPSFDIEKKISSSKEKNDNDILQQYLQNTDVTNNTMHDFLKPHASILEEETEKSDSVTKNTNVTLLQNKEGNISAIPLSQSTEVNEHIFQGLTFVVTGFDDEEVIDCINTLGGKIVSNTFAGIPDYGVVPACGAPLKHTVNEIVTKLFIDDCINNEEVVNIEYYHRPISVVKHLKPLSGCVITLSMYTGVERSYLSELAEQLGAMCQDIFARKTNHDKNTYGNTHLICPTPEGNKYKAAVKWKLPVVTAEWLKSCAAQSSMVDETPFLVGETMAPERSNNCTMQDNSATINENLTQPPAMPRQIVTPKRYLPQITNDELISNNTPLINKRLSLLMNNTPQSPFHVATPESPYGQIFKPNPSPDTRKAWVKWVNNFPDLRVEEPPLKRRPLSTPLSELKRRLWHQCKTQGKNEEQEADTSMTLPSNDMEDDVSTDIENVNQFNDILDTHNSTKRKLSFSNQGSSPLQNNQINVQIAQLEEALQRTSTVENRQFSSENTKKYENTEPTDHMPKYMGKESQPDTIGWEDPVHFVTNRPSVLYEEKEEEENQEKENKQIEQDQTQEQEQKESNGICSNINLNSVDWKDTELRENSVSLSKPKFMLSGIRDKIPFEKAIQNLGGEVSTDANFDSSATHLVCIRPSRNEKMLGSIAAGKWVLHCLYIQDSENNGELLDEECYEWGNPKSKGIIPDPSGETEKAIAAAAYRWRLKLWKENLNGPFHNMVALLLVSDEKYDQFRRLIEAGGGAVVQSRPPYDTNLSGKKITHCFVNVKQVHQPIDWAMLANRGILCFAPQYLSDHLMAESPLNPRERVLPEFKKYLALLPK